MTHIDLIATLERYVKNAGTIRRAADQLGVSASHLCRVLNSERSAGKKILRALGLTRVGHLYEPEKDIIVMDDKPTAELTEAQHLDEQKNIYWSRARLRDVLHEDSQDAMERRVREFRQSISADWMPEERLQLIGMIANRLMVLSYDLGSAALRQEAERLYFLSSMTSTWLEDHRQTILDPR